MRLGVRLIVALSLISGGLVAAASPATAAPAWSVVETALPPSSHAEMYGVSCATASDCVAVGKYSSRTEASVLTERWDGKTWSATRTSSPLHAFISAVDCPSAGSCYGVGVIDGASMRPLAEHWDGTNWVVMPTPSVTDGALSSVTCPTSTSCFAIGRDLQHSFVMHFDGTSWMLMASPPNGTLKGLSCATASRCVGVGGSTTPSKGFAALWNGKKWTAMTVANTPHAVNYLYAVSCPTTTSCYAVGNHSGSGPGLTQVEHWNGDKWSMMTSPNVAGMRTNWLTAVSCSTATNCVAVGIASNTTRQSALIERLSGKTWSLMKSSLPARPSSQLFAVACPSTGRCIGVGRNLVKAASTPLVLQYK